MDPISQQQLITGGGAAEKVYVEDAFSVDRYLGNGADQRLIENAINYGCSNNKPSINVGAKKNENLLSIWVSDNGIGIKETDKDKVIERFVRLDASRSLKGSGLGLSLVNSAVKFHEGSLKLINAKPSGLIVLIEIPIDS